MNEFHELACQYDAVVKTCWTTADGRWCHMGFIGGKKKWFRRPSKAEKYILKRYGEHIIK